MSVEGICSKHVLGHIMRFRRGRPDSEITYREDCRQRDTVSQSDMCVICTQHCDAEHNPTLKYCGIFPSRTAAMCFPEPR